MKVQLNQKILVRISQQIEQNPLWAMLLTNEYLNPNTALHQAIQAKVRLSAQNKTYSAKARALSARILRGEKLADLPANTAQLLSQTGCSFSSAKFIFAQPKIAKQEPLRQRTRTQSGRRSILNAVVRV